MELLRPKVLIMPSPLQSNEPPPPPEPTESRNGFQLSKDGSRPLPPGARASSRPVSAYSVMEADAATPVGLTPNPRMSMTLSQLTFRNTLMVDGHRDPTYIDIDENLPRVTEDGEQAQVIPEEEEAEGQQPDTPPPVVIEELARAGRGAGKLYGRSLIDDLEKRKAEMRSKQRYSSVIYIWWVYD